MLLLLVSGMARLVDFFFYEFVERKARVAFGVNGPGRCFKYSIIVFVWQDSNIGSLVSIVGGSRCSCCCCCCCVEKLSFVLRV